MSLIESFQVVYIIFKNVYSFRDCKNYLKLLSNYADKKYSVMLNGIESFLISQIYEKVKLEKNLGLKADIFKKFKLF